jgi:uncharacterized protein (TIGR03435 family)
MSVFRWVFLCVLLALPGAAQSPAFEVVSVKPDNTQDFRDIRMKVLPGVPDWANREQYDIEAKPPDGAFPAGLPTSEARAKMQAMLQALLADRFNLVIRRETKDMARYALTVAKGGPKLQTATIEEKDCPVGPTDGPSCHQFMGGQGRGLHAKAVDMKDLAGFIENWTDHPVVDRTGLDGLFAMDTDGWTSTRALGPPPRSCQPDWTALRGRRHVRSGSAHVVHGARPAGGPVDTYVVEHMEKPTAN